MVPQINAKLRGVQGFVRLFAALVTAVPDRMTSAMADIAGLLRIGFGLARSYILRFDGRQPPVRIAIAAKKPNNRARIFAARPHLRKRQI